jgi:hypothetical protein
MGNNYQNPGNLSIIDHGKNRTARVRQSSADITCLTRV